jgi:hypothetical protein
MRTAGALAAGDLLTDHAEPGPPGAAASPDSFTRMAWLSLPVLVWGLGLQLALKLKAAPLFVDFLTMWTGGRMAWTDAASIYHPAVVDQAQAWLLGAGAQDRPFPYPPISLLAFGPLGRLPFWTASIVWIAPIAVAFGVVAVRLAPRHRWLAAALILLGPGSIWAALSGQCVFLTGALALAGTSQLERRPILAGALLGAAAGFKPTILLMAPVALVGGGHWRSLISAGVCGLALVGLSALIWGPGLWLEWLAYAPHYLTAITANTRYVTAIVAPAGLAAQLGLGGVALLVWRFVFMAAAAVGAFLVFRRTRALWARLSALFGASLLATPYAMNYEMTLLLPGAVLALMAVEGARARWLAFGAYWALVFAGLPVVGGVAFLLYIGLTLGCGLADDARKAPSPARVEPAVA